MSAEQPDRGAASTTERSSEAGSFVTTEHFTQEIGMEARCS
jgi:hypothetical protein